ncbi:MAG TPA: hypothetical protein VKQ36_01635 [Ktedonobacterales bacterium]|nr:hypothetical protein [Ktedonobacterales bacterium]
MRTDPTPYAEVNVLLGHLLSGIQAARGEKLVGPLTTTPRWQKRGDSSSF